MKFDMNRTLVAGHGAWSANRELLRSSRACSSVLPSLALVFMLRRVLRPGVPAPSPADGGAELGGDLCPADGALGVIVVVVLLGRLGCGWSR